MKIPFKKSAPAPKGRQAKRGSSAMPVYSYYQNRPRDTGIRKPATPTWRIELGRYGRRLKSMSLLAWAIFALVLLSIGRLVYLSSSPIVRIDTTTLALRDASIYRDAAKKAVSASLLNRSKVTFDSAAVATRIEKQFPEVSAAETTYDLFGSRPVIRLYFYEPKLRLSSAGKEWVIDENGTALDNSTSRPNLPLLIDNIGLTIEKGGAALPKSNVDYVLTVAAFAKAQSINLEKLTLPLVAHELDLKETGKGYVVKLNLDEPVDTQVGDWLAARSNLGDQPTEYVDVRAGEKVFWK